jgi:hypothetical protein
LQAAFLKQALQNRKLKSHAAPRNGNYGKAEKATQGAACRATAIGFVSVLSRLPVHPANAKAKNRAIIFIFAIPFCRFPNRTMGD